MTDRVVVRRRIAASREELFDAWTDAEGMRLWMCPGDITSVDVQMEVRVGGSLVIVMRDAHKRYEHRGEFTTIERPAKLAFTWTAQATDLVPTLVTLEFFEVGESETDLVLTHENFSRKEVSDRYRGGWGQILSRLEQYLVSSTVRLNMANIEHSLQIQAEPEAIYPLVSTGKGFAQWWAEDITESGGAVELGFFKRATVYRLRLKVDEPPLRAEWSCETGDEWNNTQIRFRLERRGSATVLRFTHADWRSETDYFVSCNTTWGELMYRLKVAAEGKSRGPLFLSSEMAY